MVITPSKKSQPFRVTQINPWSALKTGFMLSVAFSIVFTVTIIIFWVLLTAAGFLTTFGNALGDLLGTSTVDFPSLLSLPRVLGLCLVFSALQIALWSGSALVWSVLYNLVVGLTGGIQVSLKEDN
jgi:hypothetical protein